MLLVDWDGTVLVSSLGGRLVDMYVSSGSVRSLCRGGAVPCLLSAAALLALTMVLKCLLQVRRYSGICFWNRAADLSSGREASLLMDKSDMARRDSFRLL